LQSGFGTFSIRAVFERQESSVALCDLLTQGKADSRTAGLGSKEWDKEVGRIRQTRSFILDRDFQITVAGAPADQDLAARFTGGINRVSNQIDEQLFKLVAIAVNAQLRSG